MPTISHKVLTGVNLHEPKGVSGASKGAYYAADGLGSGSWVRDFHGWASYVDNAAAQSITTTPTKMTLNGLGTGVTTYLPFGVSSLWDTASNKIVAAKLGDLYNIQLTLPITARATAVDLLVTVDVGGAGGITSVAHTVALDVDATAPFTVSTNFTLPCGSDLLAQGGQIFLATDAGTVSVEEPTILISRTYSKVV